MGWQLTSLHTHSNTGLGATTAPQKSPKGNLYRQNPSSLVAPVGTQTGDLLIRKPTEYSLFSREKKQPRYRGCMEFGSKSYASRCGQGIGVQKQKWIPP